MKQLIIILLTILSLTSYSQGSKYTVKGNGSGGSNVGDSVKKNTDTLVIHNTRIIKNTDSLVSHNTRIGKNNDSLISHNTRIERNMDSSFRFPYAPTDSTYGLGTSIVAGFGLTNSSNSFFNALGRYYNKSFSNYSVSATGVRKAYYQISTNKRDLVSYPILIDAYFNNVRVTSSATVRYNTARAGMRAIAALNWLQNIQFIYSGVSGTLNSNVTYSTPSGWAGAGSEAILLDYGSRAYWYRHNSTAQAGCNMAIKASTTANETMTISNVQGSGIAIGTFGVTSGYSRIQYAVDGNTIGTYDPNGQTYTGFIDGGTTDGIINDAIVITGLKDTAHTVVLTFLDAGVLTKIDYVGGLITPWASKAIPMYVLDAYHMNSTGYATVGYVTTAAVLDSASFYVKQNLQSTFPGYSFGFVPTNRYYDPSISAQIQSDGVHPTVLGNNKILNAVTDIIGNYPINNGTAVSAAVFGTTNYFPVFTNSSTVGNSRFFQDTTVFKINTASKYAGLSIKNTTTDAGGQSWLSIGDDFLGASNNIAALVYYPNSRTTSGLVTANQMQYFGGTGVSGGQLFTNYSSTAPFIFSSSGTAAANEIFSIRPATNIITSALPYLTISHATVKPMFKIKDASGLNASFYNNYANTANLAINRNPATGTFETATLGSAQFTLTGDATGGFFSFYTSNAINTTPTETVRININGITSLYKGAAVASAATITPTGNLFHVTGTTTITSVSATGITAGTTIRIIFDGALTFTDGSNLLLAGNFVTTADDTITLTYDGTSWFEVARSVN